MKKLFVLIFAMSCMVSHAQNHFTVELNAHTTNDFLATIGSAVLGFVPQYADETLSARAIGGFNFPVTVSNDAPESFGKMRGGYTRAFSNPFKHPGDYNVGVSCAWDNVATPIGAYAGVDYKSREVVFKDDKRNDRTNYVSPELGLRLRLGASGSFLVQAGAAYDMVTSYKGECHDYEKEAVNSGVTANFGLGYSGESFSVLVKYAHPTYNYYNKSFSPDNGITMPFKDVDRKMGYISVTLGFVLDD